MCIVTCQLWFLRRQQRPGGPGLLLLLLPRRLGLSKGFLDLLLNRMLRFDLGQRSRIVHQEPINLSKPFARKSGVIIIKQENNEHWYNTTKRSKTTTRGEDKLQQY